MNIETVWNNIVKHEGEVFETVTGIKFTYVVLNDHVIQPYVGDETRWKLSKHVFEKALSFPVFGGHPFNQTIIGASYVAGILNDIRIK